MPQFTDIHCHVLPGVDDGPQESEEAQELVAALAELGFSEFYPTPHQKAGAWAPTREACVEAAATLRLALADQQAGATINDPAAENMWDELFLERQEEGFPTYPSQRAFLIEFPLDTMPPAIGERLFHFRVNGLLPVVAHVERYKTVVKDPKKLEAIARSAALTVNLSALGGMQGFWAGRQARKLVEEGWANALATDAHTLTDVKFCKAGLRWVRKRLGEDTANKLLAENPRRIVAGDLPD